MRPASFLSILAATLGARAAAPDARRPDQRDIIIPNRFIIEVDTTSNLPQQRLSTRHLDSVYAGLRARDVEFEIAREFRQPDVFVGASVTIKKSEDIAAVQSLTGVKAIHPVRRYDRPSRLIQRAEAGAATQSTQSQTGVDKLHELGIKGKGIKVAIVDSGIDYEHPNLGGGFGPDSKVIGGYDLVGDDFFGTDPVPDDDPRDTCNGIGSHLAGVVAASGENEYNITGVAPEASLLAYRIYSCFGSTNDEVILEAFTRAVEDGADIITMSLTGWNFSSSDPIAIAASRIVESGKVFVAGAGDLGTFGGWFSSTPASSPGVIAVGSVEQNGLMSDFSTYGPTYELYSQPAVAAPGREVLSTIPPDLGLGNFAPLTGTDVAAAYVAGAAALLLQHKGKEAVSGKAARDLFETNASPIPASPEEGSPLQTVTQAGSGSVNVFGALFATTVVSPGELLLNDTKSFKGSHSISITNAGNATREYKLSHIAAGTALTIKENSILPETGPVPLSDATAQVTISTEELTISAGETIEVAVTIAPPSGIDASRLPVYSGFIVIDSEGDSQRVSYLGLAANIKDQQIFDPAPDAFGSPLPFVAMGFGDPVTAPYNFTFEPEDDFSFPAIWYRMAFGSPYLRWDLVDSSVTEAMLESGPFDGVDVVGSLVDYTDAFRDPEFISARGYSMRLTPYFFNGTHLPNGSFRFVVRALRVSGNPERLEDWESWLSPVIGFDIVI